MNLFGPGAGMGSGGMLTKLADRRRLLQRQREMENAYRVYYGGEPVDNRGLFDRVIGRPYEMTPERAVGVLGTDPEFRKEQAGQMKAEREILKSEAGRRLLASGDREKIAAGLASMGALIAASRYRELDDGTLAQIASAAKETFSGDYGRPIQGLDEQGNLNYYWVDKGDGNLVKVEGVRPKPPSEFQLETDEEGRLTGMRYGPQQGDKTLQRKQVLDTQSKLMLLGGLADIGRLYSEEFLTIPGKLSHERAAFVDRLGGLRGYLPDDIAGIPFGRLSEEDKRHVSRARQFYDSVNQAFNDYRRLVTGAAASYKEIERLRDSIFNTKQGPEEFRASLQQFTQKMLRGYIAADIASSHGLNPGTAEFRRAVDEVYAGLNNPDQVAGALEGLGVPEEMIYGLMVSAGY